LGAGHQDEGWRAENVGFRCLPFVVDLPAQGYVASVPRAEPETKFDQRPTRNSATASLWTAVETQYGWQLGPAPIKARFDLTRCEIAKVGGKTLQDYLRLSSQLS
jgi:hypothetical protein